MRFDRNKIQHGPTSVRPGFRRRPPALFILIPRHRGWPSSSGGSPTADGEKFRRLHGRRRNHQATNRRQGPGKVISMNISFPRTVAQSFVGGSLLPFPLFFHEKILARQPGPGGCRLSRRVRDAGRAVRDADLDPNGKNRPRGSRGAALRGRVLEGSRPFRCPCEIQGDRPVRHENLHVISTQKKPSPLKKKLLRFCSVYGPPRFQG